MNRTFHTFLLNPYLEHASSRYYHFTFAEADVRSVYLWDGLTMRLTTSPDWIGEPGSDGTYGHELNENPAIPDPTLPSLTRGATLRALY